MENHLKISNVSLPIFAFGISEEKVYKLIDKVIMEIKENT